MVRKPKSNEDVGPTQKTHWRDGLKRVGNVYYYRFSDGVRIRHGSTRCKELGEAKIWLKEFKAAHNPQSPGIRGIPTLEALLSLWEAAVGGVFSEKHVQITLQQIRKHFEKLLKLPINKLTHQVVQPIVTGYLTTEGFTKAINGRLIPRPHTAGGVEALIRRLNTVMGYAKDLGLITKIPYFVKIPETQEIDRPILSAHQISEFIRIIDESRNPHVRLAVRLMVALGIREGEALAVRWEWFRQGFSIYCGRGKTRRAQAIPVPEWLKDYILALSNRQPSGLMMPSPRVDKHGNALPHFGQFTKKAIRKAGLAVGVADLSPHCLRATFATIHDSEVGSTLSETQALMNHKPGSPVTQKHYIRRNSSRLKARQEAAAIAMGMSKGNRVDVNDSETVPMVRICNNVFWVAYK